MLKAAAREVVIKLPLDIRRPILALRRQMRLERRVILLDKWLKAGALRAVAHIRRRAGPGTGFPASRPSLHTRILARLASFSASQPGLAPALRAPQSLSAPLMNDWGHLVWPIASLDVV